MTVKTAHGPVTVQDATRDMSARVMNARVVGSGIDAVLTVSSNDDAGVQSFTASLSDASGQLLYSIETRVDEATGTTTTIEATAQDYLSMTRPSKMTASSRFTMPMEMLHHSNIHRSRDEQERRAINFYRYSGNSGFTDRLPAAMREYVRGAEAFHEYYLPHENSTIHNNFSG
jgi:hypothetical protein